MSSDLVPARIALIHALAESVAPARAAFDETWPEAYAFDLLDTSLAVDLDHAGRLDLAMMQRFATLADYASSSQGKAGKVAGILFTCSAFAPAIDAVKRRLAIPVLRPNEAAFEAALAIGSRIGLVVSFAPSATSLVAELSAMAADLGRPIAIDLVIADGALAALKTGDGDGHDARVAAAAQRLGHVDVVILGQFSLARARTAVEAVITAPVITTPGSAVAALRRRVAENRRRACATCGDPM